MFIEDCLLRVITNKKKSEEVLGYCYIHGELNEQGMTNAHDFLF